MDAYSLDLRKRVLKDADAGMGTREVALKYDVSESWVRRLKQRGRESGEIAPRSSRNGVQPKWLTYADQLRQLVKKKPDINLRELREELNQGVSQQTLSRALRQLQLTFKKSNPCCRTRPPRCAGATCMVAGRDAWDRSPTLPSVPRSPPIRFRPECPPTARPRDRG